MLESLISKLAPGPIIDLPGDADLFDGCAFHTFPLSQSSQLDARLGYASSILLHLVMLGHSVELQ